MSGKELRRDMEAVGVVIIAGGRGERFWPRSRRTLPKQFLAITGARTMLQQAVDRASRLVSARNIFVVTPADLAPQARKQLPNIPRANILQEPDGRNTAAAVALVAVRMRRTMPGGIMVVLPADPVVGDVWRFLEILRFAVDAARRTGALVTVGMKPSRAETGYGYIRRGELIEERRPSGRAGSMPLKLYRAESFTEKPQRKLAERYFRSGRYYWNGGMFIWTLEAIWNALGKHMPRLAQAMEKFSARTGQPDEALALRRAYAGLESISIDFGVMEKAANVLVVEGDFPWEDIGSWAALEKFYPGDVAGNVARGPFAGLDSSGCLAVGDGILIAAIGIKDMVIVATDDAVLVCPKSRAQDVKKLVEKLSKDRRFSSYC